MSYINERGYPSSEKKFYAYLILDPRTLWPFYGGKGSEEWNRIEDHEWWVIKHPEQCTDHRDNIIKELHALGLRPLYEIVFETDEEHKALQVEIELIALYGRRDIGTGILTNHTKGGSQPPSWKGKIKSEEHCRNISKAKMRHSVSEETRQKISDKNRGRIPTDEERRKMSIAKGGTGENLLPYYTLEGAREVVTSSDKRWNWTRARKTFGSSIALTLQIEGLLDYQGGSESASYLNSLARDQARSSASNQTSQLVDEARQIVLNSPTPWYWSNAREAFGYSTALILFEEELLMYKGKISVK